MIDELTELKRSYIHVSSAKIPNDLADLREEVAEFVTNPDVSEWDVNWEDDNVPFLRAVGLPHSAPSMIEFRTPAETDSQFVYIGFNNYGDRIAVVKATGNVVYINHDSDNRIEYMNHDPIALFRSICAFAELVDGQAGFPEKIAVFDSEAIQTDRWWHREHLGWISDRE